MYLNDTHTGNVIRKSDNKVVAPVSDPTDQDYVDYVTWVNEGNIPEDFSSYEQSGQALKDEKLKMWELIKQERDRRKTLGIQVGSYWFHSDVDSRIQWLGLKDTARDMIMDGADKTSNISIGGSPVLWKTLSGAFIPVNIQLAMDVNNATKVLDADLFKNAELHRANMIKSSNPEEYDYSTGWPLSYKEYQENASSNI